MHTIRRLRRGEAAIYRSLRLEALRDSPEAFSTTYESAVARDHASWVAQADASAEGVDRATFIAWDGCPIGLAAIYRGDTHSSTGELLQMWMNPSHRGASVAKDLLDQLCEWAVNVGITSIRAEVTVANFRALRFYLKCGFEPLTTDTGATVLIRQLIGATEADSPSVLH